jgi:hypothetical protein
MQLNDPGIGMTDTALSLGKVAGPEDAGGPTIGTRRGDGVAENRHGGHPDPALVKAA